MKKFQLAFAAIISILGIGGAYATTTRVNCDLTQKVYLDKFHTETAAPHICLQNATVTCTYTFNGGVCQTGEYRPS